MSARRPRLLVRRMVPRPVFAQLWGDRDRWGRTPRTDDPMWDEWLSTYADFYEQNQRVGIGRVVNGAGYRVMRRIDLEGRTVLEVGPGEISHVTWWRGRPRTVHLVDVDEEMACRGSRVLQREGVPHEVCLVERTDSLPFPDGSVDVVVSFFSLEHIHPIQPYLAELHRILVPGGVLVGAIPAEGGLAWGLGRWLTSRRWFLANTAIDPDKVICWEHPNFADTVLGALRYTFGKGKVSRWPLPFVPGIDANLVLRFVFRKLAR